VVAAAIAGSMVTSRDDADQVVTSVSTVPEQAPVPAENASTTWSETATTLPGSEPDLFWLGDRLLVIDTENDGGDVAGEIWDPATNAATPITASGLVWRFNPAMAWTGTELLMVGGSNGPGLDQIGAAYDPASDTWRSIADPPGGIDAWENGVSGPGVWTGTEMVIWQSALAYNPSSDSWRRTEPAPLSPRAWPLTVWTGQEIVVWGGCQLDDAQCDELNEGLLGDGAAYDPASDTWRALSDSPLTPAVHAVAGWDGQRVLIAVTDPGADAEGSRTATWSPSNNEWEVIPDPMLSNRRGAASVWTGSELVIWGGATSGVGSQVEDDGAIYDPVSNWWGRITGPPGSGRRLHAMTLVGDRIYISSTREAQQPTLLTLDARVVADGESDGSVWSIVEVPGGPNGRCWQLTTESAVSSPACGMTEPLGAEPDVLSTETFVWGRVVGEVDHVALRYADGTVVAAELTPSVVDDSAFYVIRTTPGRAVDRVIGRNAANEIVAELEIGSAQCIPGACPP
jgi:hypothetical protein